MKQLAPLYLKQDYYSEIEKQIQRVFNDEIYQPLIRALKVPAREVKNSNQKTLYVHRKVINAAEIISWAKEQGFKSTLQPDDLHVTVAFSRSPVDWREVTAQAERVIITPSVTRKVKPLGDKGAVVLAFDSRKLQKDWQRFRNAGASWDWPSYTPHISISYAGADIDLSKVQPFEGNIILGGEVFGEVQEDWGKKIKELKNATDPLSKAIEKGTIYYEDGRFFGQFNAATSKRLSDMGATYNTKSQTWSYAGQIPVEISIAQAGANFIYAATRMRVLEALNNINVAQINTTAFVDKYKQTFLKLEGDFQKTVQNITIAPKLTPEMVEMLSKEWANNLDLYVKDWTEENIRRLRGMVQENAFAGRRSSAIVQAIQQNFQVSKRKAEFLARQETSLLLSKYRQQRYESIGSKRYKWSGVMDERERPDHRELQGKIFSWDNPPVTNKQTGARNNPGEDYGCRCVAIALIED